MQFFLNGYRPGDPQKETAPSEPPGLNGSDAQSSMVDVLVIGCGPTGLTLASQLSSFPEITTRIIEQKSGPLQVGQADGIACRSMEMFHAFGISERILREAYWVNETSFWIPDEARPGRIVRSRVVQDVEDGLSEFPHVILNQARVQRFYLDLMRHAPAPVEPHYSRRLLDIEIDATALDDAHAHPFTAHVERTEDAPSGSVETVRARYVVGCDGARSAVRRILGGELEGDFANQAWGVMDVLAVTDFPDIRRKCAIHSAEDGGIMIIPREGGYLTRLYVELDKLNETQRVTNLNVTIDQLISTAQKILRPYSFDVKEIAWWSVYEIGHRLCGRFDDLARPAAGARFPRMFIAGDACHTHSPKAGQGMNVSMQDTFNLGWKLASVLRGHASPTLLRTYSEERREVARDLISFDHKWARMFSARPNRAGNADERGMDPAELQAHFVRQGRFTAGLATRYAPSLITGEATHQQLAEGYTIGMRFHSAPVVRLADAKPMHLGHTLRADGRWRLFAFADSLPPTNPASRLRTTCEWLERSSQSPVRRSVAAGGDIDAVIEVIAIYQQPHFELSVEGLPPLLLPRKGRYGLVDYEKVYCPALARAGHIQLAWHRPPGLSRPGATRPVRCSCPAAACRRQSCSLLRWISARISGLVREDMMRKVLVTAGASGIGREIASAFLAAGDSVYTCDIDQCALEATARDLPGLKTRMCDVGDRKQTDAMLADAVSQLGGIDILINNAGIAGPTAPIQEVDPDQWESVLKVNLTGTFLVTRAAIPPSHRLRSRRHHPHVVGGRPVRLPQPRSLFDRQVGPHRFHEDSLDGARDPQHPSQCDSAGSRRWRAAAESLTGPGGRRRRDARFGQGGSHGEAIAQVSGGSEGHRRSGRLSRLRRRQVNLGSAAAD